jgi:hypothetical protein
MKKLVLLFTLFSLFLSAKSQLPSPKKIDSIVKAIDAQKNLLKIVCDTFPVAYSEMKNIECARFYSYKGKLVKVIYSLQYQHKDTTRINISTQLDVFYYKDSLLVKVISKDFDQSPPKDLQFYLGEAHRKKYISKETINAGKQDGAGYYIEFGYNFLEEFKKLNAKK